MSQAFTLTRGQYLTDFRLTPALVVAAIGAALVTDGPSLALIGSVITGFVAWMFSEHVTHRYLFHRLYRREHWAHHMRPASDIGVKPSYTVIAQLVMAGVLMGTCGLTVGGGLFAGYAAGYLTYLTTHHAFHRWTIPQGHWLRAAYERHEWHHMGHEVNFNVLIPLGDRLFRTYHQPPPGVIR